MQHHLDLPTSTGDLPFDRKSMTQCVHCGAMVPRENVVIKQYYNHRVTLVEHFCSDSCHHTWYLNRLRSFGL